MPSIDLADSRAVPLSTVHIRGRLSQALGWHSSSSAVLASLALMLLLWGPPSTLLSPPPAMAGPSDLGYHHMQGLSFGTDY